LQDTRLASLIENIQLERIMDRLERLARIGGAEHGITRLAFTEEDKQARTLVIEWMREAGLDVNVSAIGNIVGRLDGRRRDAPVVMAGSHIDTVVKAGKFDGTLGVVAAVEAAQLLHDSGILSHNPLEVVCFVMEESSRFKVGYAFGSKVMTGQPMSDEVLLARDRNGKTLAGAVYEMRSKEVGSTKEAKTQREVVETVKSYVAASKYPTHRIKAFVELHIEQGPLLYTTQKPIGAVTAIAAPTRLGVTFVGEQNHSGSTPMALRKDALVASAEAILAVEKICRSTENVVGTVGVMEVEPNVINAIPGKVHLAIDIRSVAAEAKKEIVISIHEEVRRIADNRSLSYSIDLIEDETPQLLSETIVTLIEESCLHLGIESYRQASGAGHDAAQMAKVVKDVGMIFVPSKNGISHDPREWTDPEDIRRGAQVLLLTLLQLIME
jgi:hydantoinase/carbamoylase family amidase